METHDSGFRYDSAELSFSHKFLLPPVVRFIAKHRPTKVFDLGCGNGSVADVLSKYAVVEGIDYEESAIKHANAAYPRLKLNVGSAYENLAVKYGHYQMVVSFEVVEHLFNPSAYARSVYDLLEPGGYAVISTPYHGYLKNLAIALSGTFDRHFTALWAGGHIKFWSMKTLRALLEQAGFVDVRFVRVGRIPPLARSMIAFARRPDVTR